MKNIYFKSGHNLLQFYNGFSLTMGFLLFAFGLQAFLIGVPGKRVVIANIFITLVIVALTIVYFHALASGVMAIAFMCFIISYLKESKG